MTGACLSLQAIRVGDRVFEFTAHEESNCDLVRLPAEFSADAAATEIGPITQRLYVKVCVLSGSSTSRASRAGLSVGRVLCSIQKSPLWRSVAV